MMPSCMKPLADKKTTRPPSIGALQRSRQMEGQEGVGDERMVRRKEEAASSGGLRDSDKTREGGVRAGGGGRRPREGHGRGRCG